MTIQERLNEAYRPLVDQNLVHERLRMYKETDLTLRELNGPFLIATSPEYEVSKPRVVIVGQENNGWNDKRYNYASFLAFASESPDRAMQELLNEYGQFNFELSYDDTFFRYFAAIRNGIRQGDTGDTQRSVLWSNLFKLNHDGKSTVRSPHYQEILALQADVFQREIEILQPDAVIFLTGPYYDPVIEQFYPGAEREPVGSYSKRQLARVIADGLPRLTFRCYHPGFINRKRFERMPWYDAIIERVRAG